MLVLLEEVNYKLKKDADLLKAAITKKTRFIEPKGIDKYEVLDCTRILIASNNDDIVDVNNDDEERRFTILKLKDNFTPKTRITFFKTLFDTCSNNRAELLSFLLDRKIKSNLRSKLKTEEYNTMANNNIDPFDQMFYDILEMSDKELNATFNTEFAFCYEYKSGIVYIKKITLKNYYDESYCKYKMTPHAFTKRIKQSRFINARHITEKPICLGNKKHAYLIIPAVNFLRLFKK